MRVVKSHNTIQIDMGRIYLTLGLIAGLYLGIQIDRNHISLDIGVIYLDIYW